MSNHYVVHLKLTSYCASTEIELKKKRNMGIEVIREGRKERCLEKVGFVKQGLKNGRLMTSGIGEQ